MPRVERGPQHAAERRQGGRVKSKARPTKRSRAQARRPCQEWGEAHHTQPSAGGVAMPRVRRGP